MTPTPVTTTRRRLATLALAGAVAVMAGTSLLLVSSGPVAAGPGAEATVTIAGERVTAVGDPGALSVAAAVDPGVAPATAGGGCGLQNPGACAIPGSTRTDALPAWRWRDIDLDMDTSGGGLGRGIKNAINTVPLTIAEMLFQLANFVWSLLLFLMKMGFDSKGLIVLGAQSINTGAAFMADKLLYFAVPLSAYVIWGFLRDFIKLKSGNPFGLMRRVLTFGLLFGMLWTVATNSAEAVTQSYAEPEDQMKQVGTIPWMANEVLSIADKAVEPVTRVVTNVDPDRGDQAADAVIGGEKGDLTKGLDPNSSTVERASGEGRATCRAYIDTIYSTYARDPAAERTLIIVSRLWENTFYQAWKSAAFGEPDIYRSKADKKYYQTNIPDRTMCHYADAVNGVSGEVQIKLARLAYGAPESAIPAWDPDGGAPNNPPAFRGFDASNKDDMRKAMSAWAACRLNDDGTWGGQPAFNGVWEDEGSNNKFNENGGELCRRAFADRDGSWDDKHYIFGSQADNSTNKGDDEHREQLRAARTWSYGFSGANSGGRIVGGFIALIVALLFLYSFGLIGLGLTVAMMMAVALLALALPAAFVLAAIGKTRQAVPLFKMTLFSLLSHAFITLLLSLIIIVSGIFQNLLGSFLGLPLMMRSLVNGLAPVAAFFIVRKLMKSLGMGDMFSTTGALSFAGAAALKGGGSRFAGTQKKAASGDYAKKTPVVGKRLNRLDGMAPTHKNWGVDGRMARKERNAKEDAAERKKRKERLDYRANKERTRISDQEAAKMRLEGKDPASRAGREELKQRVDARMKALDDQRAKGRRADDAGRLKKAARFAKDTVTDAPNIIDRARMPGNVKDRLRQAQAAYDDARAEKDAADKHVNGRWAALRAGTSTIDPLGLLGISHVPGEIPISDRYQRPDTISGPDAVGAAADARQTFANTLKAHLEEKAAVAKMLHDVAVSVGGTPAGPVGSRDLVLSPEEQASLKVTVSSDYQVEDSWVVASSGGRFVFRIPDGVERSQLPAEMLARGETYLPDEDRGTRMRKIKNTDGTIEERPETPSEEEARKTVILRARGAIDAEGNTIDQRAIAIPGFDPNSERGKAILAEYASTGSNADLDGHVLAAVDTALEERLVEYAYRICDVQAAELIRRAGGSASSSASSSGAGSGSGTGSGSSASSSGTSSGSGTGSGSSASSSGSGSGASSSSGGSGSGTGSGAGSGASSAAGGSSSSGGPGSGSSGDGDVNLKLLADATKQMLLAVNASKELLEEARLSGNSEAIARAAERISTTMDRLETNQTKLVEGVGESLAESFENHLKAQSVRDENFEKNFEAIFSQGVSGIETSLTSINTTLDQFKQGVIGLKEAIEAIDRHVEASRTASTDAMERLGQALAGMDTISGQVIRERRTGNAGWRAPDARTVAESSGAMPLPPPEPGAR